MFLDKNGINNSIELCTDKNGRKEAARNWKKQFVQTCVCVCACVPCKLVDAPLQVRKGRKIENGKKEGGKKG